MHGGSAILAVMIVAAILLFFFGNLMGEIVDLLLVGSLAAHFFKPLLIFFQLGLAPLDYIIFLKSFHKSRFIIDHLQICLSGGVEIRGI